MFEQSIIDATPRKSAALAVSLTAQTLLVGLLILLPLIYSDRLPLLQPAPITLTLPLSTPPPPEPVETSATTPSPHPSLLPARIFRLPEHTAPAATGIIGSLPLSSSLDGVGAPAGVFFTSTVEMPRILAIAPVAPNPPAIAPQPDQPHPVGGDVQAAKLIRKIVPVYPPLARQARISGLVRLRAIISKDGSIRQLQLISGSPLLVRAAMDAVRQWLYQPTLLNGQPVEVVAPIDVIFTLSQ